MAILDLQRRLTEAGRIRIGQQVETNSGKKRPAKLETFRLTSSDRTRIQQAAQLYGGTPAEWQAPSGPQWEVVTEADALNVIVPPSEMAFSQFYEMWGGGGCLRRCDGRQESISDGPCLCDPDNRECNIHTRLSVMLRDLPGLGVWRIDTSGYYAALELQGAVEVIQLAAGRGHMLPARLRLDQRMVKRQGQGTRRFAVPVLDVEMSPAQLMSGTTTPAVQVEQRQETPRAIDGRRALTPVPDTVPQRPVASIAEQATTEKPRRRRTAQEVPATGVEPRTVAQANSDAEPDRSATIAQNRKMHALFRQVGVTERDERLTITGHILGRPLDSSKGLATDDASKIIDTLEEWVSSGKAADIVREILNAATLAEIATEVEQ